MKFFTKFMVWIVVAMAHFTVPAMAAVSNQANLLANLGISEVVVKAKVKKASGGEFGEQHCQLSVLHVIKGSDLGLNLELTYNISGSTPFPDMIYVAPNDTGIFFLKRERDGFIPATEQRFMIPVAEGSEAVAGESGQDALKREILHSIVGDDVTAAAESEIRRRLGVAIQKFKLTGMQDYFIVRPLKYRVARELRYFDKDDFTEGVLVSLVNDPKTSWLLRGMIIEVLVYWRHPDAVDLALTFLASNSPKDSLSEEANRQLLLIKRALLLKISGVEPQTLLRMSQDSSLQQAVLSVVSRMLSGDTDGRWSMRPGQKVSGDSAIVASVLLKLLASPDATTRFQVMNSLVMLSGLNGNGPHFEPSDKRYKAEVEAEDVKFWLLWGKSQGIGSILSSTARQ